jgi:hypothetical protein
MLDAPVRDQIIAELRGNPLALLELPRGLTATAAGQRLRNGRHGGAAEQGRGELRAKARCAYPRTPDACCCSPRPSPSGIRCCSGGRPSGSVSGRKPPTADAHELLAIGQRGTFRHPLVRSALYSSAPLEERQSVHLALAEATDHEADPGPSSVASGRGGSGARRTDRAGARTFGQPRAEAGWSGGAAAFLRRAVALSVDPARRTDRALAGAEASCRQARWTLRTA